MARHGGREGKFWGQRRQDHGVFAGIEHRQKGHQQGNKLAEKEYIIAKADARSTKGPRGELCTSRGAVVVVREILAASVVDG